MKRIVQLINQSWKFYLGDTIDNDAAQTVCLPHTISLTPAISSGCRNYQGICCYQKELFIPTEYEGKKIALEFEGAMGVTNLWVNEVLVKTHFCGYIPLVADITDIVQFGVDNKIVLRLDNSDDGDVPPGKPQGDLDFTYDGGLYRDARLIVTDKLYITNSLLANEVAGGGVFVSFEDVTQESALVHAKVHVKNEYLEGREFVLHLSLKDDVGSIVCQSDMQASLTTGNSTHLDADLQIKSPNLWSPETPYLYTLTAEICCKDIVCDSTDTIVGIRTFTFTTDKGIIFNGNSRTISGANYHHTYPYIGNGVPNSLLRRDAMKLREIGMKNIRSHYPFGTAFTDACNELGLTLIVSAPGWQWFKEGVFVQHAYQNVRDMIRWQRNNPCIILWEPILNETPMPSSFQQKVQDIVHEEYPYSPCYTASDHGPTDISYREYDPGMLEPGMEGFTPLIRYGAEKEYPVWIREYNDAPDNWTDHNCAWRSPRGWGDYPMVRSVKRMLGIDPQCEDSNYIDVYNKSNICGYGIWPGIEHNRGYHINPCWGGFMDLFRIPKFSYYFIKSQMDIQEAGAVLFIANWWTEISPEDVVVYSNADTVRLYHNDQLVDELKPDDFKVAHPPFTFKDVRSRFKHRERSILKAEAIVNGQVVAVATQQSPGVPAALKLEADFMGIPMQANGADMVMVYCKILDSDGNVVPLTGDRHPILFSVEGEGEVVGDWKTGANPICAEAGIASVLIRSTQTAGEIKVKAQMLWKQNNPRIEIKDDEISFNSSN